MQQHRPSVSRLLAIIAVVALALVSLAPSALAHGRGTAAMSYTVTHDAVTITLANPASDGHQLGDLRVTTIPVAGEDGQVGRLDSTLTTVGIDTPNAGDEIRISVLVFSFNDNADQIVVQGTAYYPKAGGTIAAATTIERPIVGGSGTFAGATGTAETEHLADGTWRHTFTIAGPGSRAMPDHPMGNGKGMGHHTMASPAPAAPVGGIIRTTLGSVDPSTADGLTLGLWHYTIPAGEALVPHTHPGFQVARIVSGTLTYEVISGEVTILRGDGSTETASSGETVILEAGDSVVENPELQHFGANNGTKAVEIYASSLFAVGAPPAEPLPSTAP